MNNIFLNFLKHSCIFLLLMSTTGYSADPKSFSEYLKKLEAEKHAVREYTFNSDLKILEGNYANYSVKNIIVAFDMSGSTELTKQDYDRQGNKIIRPVNATKHIALAQAEALSLVLKYLAKTNSNDAMLYLTGFSLTAQQPLVISFPQPINYASDLTEIANNLPNILPYPQFDGTYLTSALQEVLKVSSSINMGHTLFIIVTDGQTSDSDKTSALLKDVIMKFTGNADSRFRFDILSIGAGSIIDKSNKIIDANSTKIFSTAERFSNFSHVYSSNSHFGGAQCNRGYLELLTSLKSPLGKGQYGGAFKDYEELQEILSGFFANLDNGAHKLFIEADNGGFWHAKDWQLNVLEQFLSSGHPPVKSFYSSRDFEVEIKISSKTGLITMTNQKGVKRRCLWLDSSHISAVQREDGAFDISSPYPVVQNFLNRNFPKRN